jgi:hypothetical protein
LAGLPDRRFGEPAPDGSRADLCRRYALFTLVGIAGEDDLDAPDLNGYQKSAESSKAAEIVSPVLEWRRKPVNGKDRLRQLLDPAASAALRDELVREAPLPRRRRTLGPNGASRKKNTLTASDARLVELAFELRLSGFESEAANAARTAAPEAPDPATPLLALRNQPSAVLEARSGEGTGPAQPRIRPVSRRSKRRSRRRRPTTIARSSRSGSRSSPVGSR